jgi:O-methyltransferase involved in polyketide biosynthesis
LLVQNIHETNQYAFLFLNAQVVAIAAGYDTRAYRFAPVGGGVSFFEV